MKLSMTFPSTRCACGVLLIAALFNWQPLHAQTEPVLKGKDLNQKNLVDALSPPAAAPAAAAEEEEVRLRSIRVQRDQPSAKVAEQTAKAPPPKTSASVLVTFITNSSELSDRARSSLDVVGQALQADQLAKFKFVIEGHADARGNPDDNLRLSQARAESVVAYLVAQHHVAPDRLKPVGKGDTEPYNTRQIDAPENRRVTIVTVRE
jgi:outer membrane protein OmpA-like peptidoglycan-associated protein